MRNRIVLYFRLMRFDRPVGFLLLLWPTAWALWLAAPTHHPSYPLLAIFVSGVVIMRAAGCVINDILDRHFDHQVERTRQRPLATQSISIYEAIGVFLLLSVIAGYLALQLNPITRELAILGMGLTLIYPLLKRYTHWPQLGLGLTFSWGIPMAFAAQLNHVPALAWFLYFINALWIVAYDTQYAMADRHDDLQIGIKSTAIFFGKADRLMIAILQGLVLIGLFILAYQQHLNYFFYSAWGIGIVLFLYQQWLIRSRNPINCLRAFIHNHWFGAIIFIGLVFTNR